MRAFGTAANRRTRLARAVALGLLFGGRADAFVPYRTSGTNVAFHWPRACIGMRVYVDDLPDMTPTQIMTAARGAAAAWSAAANPCSFVNIVVDQASGPGPAARYDLVNTITFRRTSWCPADPAQGCYNPAATAITSVYVSKATGEIRDADIEVNAENFMWGDAALQPDAARQDLQNTLTHEMGHMLGFDESCVPAGIPGPAPLDDMGAPSPSCDLASEAVRETTMYPGSSLNDTSKRTLAPDDQRAVCTTYPADAAASAAGLPDFVTCTSPPDGGADARGADADSADAGSADVGGADAAPDAQGKGETAEPPTGDHAQLPSQEGCGCSTGGGGPEWAALLLALFFVLRRRSGKVPLTF